MLRWLTLLILLFALTSPAHANGAMGMVYSTFYWHSWLLYVVVTVAYEALIFGRWAKLRVGKALAISALANAVTALLGAWLVSGVFGATAYSIGARSSVEPNPLWHAVFCLVVGSIFSALIEAIFWTRVIGRRALHVSILVHLAGIPLALLILLSPSRPYAGLEVETRHRRGLVRHAVVEALEKAVQNSKGKPVPVPKNWDELLELVSPAMVEPGKYSPEVLKVSGCEPCFYRLDTGEVFRATAEFNPALVGKDLCSIPKPNWLIRWKWFSRSQGVVIKADGTITITGNPESWLEFQKEERQLQPP